MKTELPLFSQATIHFNFIFINKLHQFAIFQKEQFQPFQRGIDMQMYDLEKNFAAYGGLKESKFYVMHMLLYYEHPNNFGWLCDASYRTVVYKTDIAILENMVGESSD